MSADLLREAAAKMREQAEAAESSGDGVAWYSVNEIHSALVGSTGPCANTSDAEHIASWHPAVALAVADWLDAQVARWEQVYADTQRPSPGVDQPPAIHYGDTFGAANTANHHTRHALAVARTYLGGDQ